MAVKKIIQAMALAVIAVSCGELPDFRPEEITFSVERNRSKALPDVTAETLRSMGFSVSACLSDGGGTVFSNIPARYQDSGTYSLSVPHYFPSPGSGMKYCFVAVSGNSPSSFIPDREDRDGDGRIDYRLPDLLLPLPDIVVASAMQGYAGGAVPLSFRHILARIGGVTARAASVSGHSTGAEVREVRLQVPCAGSFECFSSGYCNWEVMVADSLVEDDISAGLSLYEAGSSGIRVGTSSVSLGYPGCYSIPSDNVDGSVLRLALTAVYDIYKDGLLCEESRVASAAVVLPGGMDTIFNLTLPMDSDMPLIVVPQYVAIEDWEDDKEITENI